MAIRRRVWLDLGPFDVRYEFYCQDLDLCLTAGEAGWRVSVVDAFRVVHHHGATIGSAAGAAGRFHPALLWTDFVRAAAKRGGSGAARRATAALRAGVRLRLFGRRLRGLVGARDERWERDTASFAAGLDRLRSLEPDQLQ
jgi:GT2 family glycosyltransferase